MNIYQKINKVRQDLLQQTFKADTKGYNYMYMDLPQIESAVTKACGEYGILPVVNFENGYASIELIDIDSDVRNVSSIKIAVPVDSSMVKINDKQPVQNVGGMMTYMRRYLYMTAFSISEHDAVEDQASKQKQEDAAKELGREIAEAFQKPEETKKTFSEEEKKERCDMIDFFLELDPKAIEKLLKVKKVSSVDELETSYLRKVYNAKKGADK